MGIRMMPQGSATGRLRGIAVTAEDLDYDSLDDAAVLARMAERDVEAFDALYRRHAGYLVGICMSKLGTADEAEEIAGDILWELWQGAGGYDPSRCRLRTWLYAVGRNRCVDRLRSRARAPRQEAVSDTLPAPPNANPAHRAADRETLRKVSAAFEAIPSEHRRALELCVYQGFTHQEAADLLGEPLGTVKSRVKRALDKLRAELDPQGESS